MKTFIAMLALAAFVCSANAHCGKCEGDAKPKVECKTCKDCKEDCKCKCHAAKKDDHKH